MHVLEKTSTYFAIEISLCGRSCVFYRNSLVIILALVIYSLEKYKRQLMVVYPVKTKIFVGVQKMVNSHLFYQVRKGVIVLLQPFFGSF